jgi:hypothetical protein
LYEGVVKDLGHFYNLVKDIVNTYLNIIDIDDEDSGIDREERMRALDMKHVSDPSVSLILLTHSKTSELHLIYLLKFCRLAGQIGSIYVSEKVFAEHYMKRVHLPNVTDPDRANDIPIIEPGASLLTMLWMFLGIDATIQILIMISLIAMNYTYAKESNTFSIDNDLIVSYITDYFVSTIIILIVGYVTAKVLMVNKYFSYPTNGGANGKAFRDIIIGTCAVSSVIPFSLVFR